MKELAELAVPASLCNFFLRMQGTVNVIFIGQTNSAEMMAGVVAGYVAPFGIKHFWLDCDEPCQSGIPATYGGMPAAAS